MVQKAREKLLQMPKHLTLRDYLKIFHHCESLQYHLNIVKPTDKPVESYKMPSQQRWKATIS